MTLAESQSTFSKGMLERCPQKNDAIPKEATPSAVREKLIANGFAFFSSEEYVETPMAQVKADDAARMLPSQITWKTE